MIEPAVIETAARWAALLDSEEVSDADRADFRAWESAHPSHRAAWSAIRAFDQSLDEAGDLEHAALRQVSRARMKRRSTAAAAVLVAMLVVTGWSAAHFTASEDHMVAYQTAKGQVKTVALEDGSNLVIDTDAVVAVEMTRSKRIVELARGQVFVSVAKAPDRPFVIRTVDGTATALGTAYSVRRDDAGTRVMVTESHVRICPSDLPDACRTLGPGEQARITPAGVIGLGRIDPARASLWTSGWLEVDDRPVDEVLSEIARYRKHPVRFDPGQLRGRNVTGSYPLSEPDRALSGVADAAGLTIRYQPDDTLVIEPR
ncbi:MAG: FecR family protein [Novosphingobium sp.]|nr:FecR family protein [Novosphingobium sp.]